LSTPFSAIKRLSRNSGQGIEEFKTKVTVIAKLHHRNLCSFLAVAFQVGEHMLIYRFFFINNKKFS